MCGCGMCGGGGGWDGVKNGLGDQWPAEWEVEIDVCNYVMRSGDLS